MCYESCNQALQTFENSTLLFDTIAVKELRAWRSVELQKACRGVEQFLIQQHVYRHALRELGSVSTKLGDRFHQTFGGTGTVQNTPPIGGT